MKNKNHRITLSLLEKDYQIACPPEEEPALLNAAKELERRMRSTRLQQGVVGSERIAVLVALNLCYELQQLQNNSVGTLDDQALSAMLAKIEAALNT
ncbi:MAG TPA: cell division protein ZapA [Cellvibrionaceae bacterium]